MIIPYQQLEAETLEQVIASIVLQEGTDYGDYEGNLADKILAVKQQLESGQAVLIYSQETETIGIQLKQNLQFTDDDNLG